MIELCRLGAFVAVAEEGNVTHAAQRLGMQPPPLTRLIQGLETELDVVLPHRLPRGVRPTEAGMALLNEARIVLARAEGVVDVVRRAHRGEQGRLAMGFTSSAALHPFVPTALRKFREAFPGVSVVLEEAGTVELVAALLHDHLDAAFVRTPVGNQVGIRVEPILVEPMVAALPLGHPLGLNTSIPIKLAELAEQPFVLYRCPAGPGLCDAILIAYQQAGFSPKVVQEAPRLPATLSLVAAGLGVSLIPASMQRLGGDTIASRPLAPPFTISAPLHLAMRLAKPPPALTRFRNLVRQHIASDRNQAERG